MPKKTEKKKWAVEYCHNDGRSGKINVTTEVGESEAYSYGNKKYGAVNVLDFTQSYDLRYVHEKDLHKFMLQEYFGKGLVRATEI